MRTDADSYFSVTHEVFNVLYYFGHQIITSHQSLFAIILSSVFSIQQLRELGRYEEVFVLSVFGLRIGMIRLVL